MREGARCANKFYKRGITLYPQDELYREMAFISYYFHWPRSEVMNLDHASRRRWCKEISVINRELTPSKSKNGVEKSIVDMDVSGWIH